MSQQNSPLADVPVRMTGTYRTYQPLYSKISDRHSIAAVTQGLIGRVVDCFTHKPYRSVTETKVDPT